MGTFRETLAKGTEGALGLERPRVYSDLSPKDKKRYNADIRATNILLQELPKDIYSLINHYTDAKNIWDNVKMLLEGSELTKEDRKSQLYDDFKHFLQHKGETIHDYYIWFAKLIYDIPVKLNRGLRDSNYDQLYAYLKQHEAHANENKVLLDRFTQYTVDPLALMSNDRQNRGQGNNARGAGTTSYGGAQNRVRNANPGQARQVKQDVTGVALDEEQLLFLAGGQDNTVDEDVDEKPVHDLALNVDNVFQADDYPVYDEARPSYDSDILSEVHDHDLYQDAICEHHEEHEMHDDYVKDNDVSVVQNNVSSIPNDAYMMIYNDMYEPHAQSVSKTTRNTVVDNSLTAELATYKEQVELYERRARFELTEREQKIDEQLRIVITDRNIKEENLKKELHSVKLQLASTINHNKSMVEEVTSLKKDFK
ncbi:hypothetical protein Tco_0435308 [Tanacetum coccineum]